MSCLCNMKRLKNVHDSLGSFIFDCLLKASFEQRLGLQRLRCLVLLIKYQEAKKKIKAKAKHPNGVMVKQNQSDLTFLLIIPIKQGLRLTLH